MTSLRLILVALTASMLLPSCGVFDHYDSRNPTVSQQDATDQAWGLPPRKARGNPKLRMQYDARNDYLNRNSASAAPQAAPAPAPAPAAAAREQVAPAIVAPANLR